MSEHTTPSPETILRDFFEAHVETHPEEATTLGVREHDARLRDLSPTAMRAELARLGATLRDCASVINGGAQQTVALTTDHRLDLDSVVRYASFRVRRIEADADASNMELCALPNSALQHLLLHARTEKHWLDLEARAREVPAYLTTHTTNLRRGVKDGRTPDRAIVRAFIDRVLPGAADSVAKLGESARERGASVEIAQKIDEAVKLAADAYRALAVFAEETLLPAGRDTVRLGEQEVALRLRHTMGVEKSMTDLIKLANDEAARSRAALEEEFETKDEATLRTRVKALFAEGRCATVPEMVARYRKHCDDATALVRERKLMPVPQPLGLELAPLPRGVIDGGAITNWPAPLLDPEGRGHALYAADVEQHPIVSMKQLAIHEGIPGHYLQGVAWQRASIPRYRAVRWIGVADPIAMAESYFGTMMSVEGWAVYMEQLLQENSFFDPGRETQFFAVCTAIHAARVLVDLKLHATDITTDEAENLVSASTLLSKDYG